MKTYPFLIHSILLDLQFQQVESSSSESPSSSPTLFLFEPLATTTLFLSSSCFFFSALKRSFSAFSALRFSSRCLFRPACLSSSASASANSLDNLSSRSLASNSFRSRSARSSSSFLRRSAAEGMICWIWVCGDGRLGRKKFFNRDSHTENFMLL